MLKIKFLRINLPDGLEKTYRHLADAPFSRDGQDGFEVTSFSKNHIEAKFIEKIITKEQITDPFGNVQEIIATRYGTTELTVSNFSGIYVLALRNPSRSVNALVKRFSALVGNGFFAASIVLDVEKFGQYVKLHYNEQALVATKVFASNLTLDNHSTANIELLSSSNALSDLKHHFPSQDILIERARFSLTDHGRKSQLEIKASGVVGITGVKSKVLEEIITSFVSDLYK